MNTTDRLFKRNLDHKTIYSSITIITLTGFGSVGIGQGQANTALTLEQKKECVILMINSLIQRNQEYVVFQKHLQQQQIQQQERHSFFNMEVLQHIFHLL